MAQLGEILAAQREEAASRAGATPADIELSRKCGIDPQDVCTFRRVSAGEMLVIVVRCPKLAALAWHGTFPAKTASTSAKTSESGTVLGSSGRIMVSDYDLMSLWKRESGVPRKIVASAEGGAKRGRYPEEATQLLVRLNGQLVTKIQHGCQDDFASPSNPGVKPADHFAAFDTGNVSYLRNPVDCADFYKRNDLVWPYDAAGKYQL